MSLLRRRAKAPIFAVCERATAGVGTPRHIRKLTENGMFPGGGADAAALCGAQVAWDLHEVKLVDVAEMAARPTDVFRICAACAVAAGPASR